MESNPKQKSFSESGFFAKPTTGPKIQPDDPVEIRLEILRQRADRGEHLFYKSEFVKFPKGNQWGKFFDRIGRNTQEDPFVTRRLGDGI